MFLKIGHRGARGYEIENTLESFKKAIAGAERNLIQEYHNVDQNQAPGHYGDAPRRIVVLQREHSALLPVMGQCVTFCALP